MNGAGLGEFQGGHLPDSTELLVDNCEVIGKVTAHVTARHPTVCLGAKWFGSNLSARESDPSERKPAGNLEGCPMSGDRRVVRPKSSGSVPTHIPLGFQLLYGLFP